MKKNIIFLIFSFLLVLSSIYLIYNISLFKNIENNLRSICMIVIILITITLIFFLNKKNKNKTLKILTIIYIIIMLFISINANKVYKSINKVTKSYKTTSISLVTLSSNNNDTISGKVGTLKNIEMEKVNKEYLVEQDNYIDLINGLYNNELDYVILPTNYKNLFQNTYPNLNNDTKIIYTEEKEIKLEVDPNKKIDKPFTVLLMGVDSQTENIKTSSFNGDALMLITFNPDTLWTTILSIPRDMYVPISCFSETRKNKITHAAWYGEDCMIDTIQNFLDINIDYYVKINFKGAVKLVDSLGGIDVDVPMDFCESDSNRIENQICLSKGYNHLNGEEALALSRHRKTINDIIRGQNQQLVLKGIIDRVKDIDSLDKIYSILDIVSNNMETNITINEIFSLYDVVKKILTNSSINIQRLYINGYDEYIYDYSNLNKQGTKMTLYNLVPYDGSIKEVSSAMKQNLGLIENVALNKDIIIGKDNTNGTRVSLLPNFINQDEQTVVSYCNNNNIKLNISYEENNNNVGKVISQSLSSGMDLDYVDELSIVVGKKEDKIICSLEKNKNHPSCQIPDFINKDYGEFEKWVKDNNYSYKVKVNKITKGKLYDKNKKGMIVEQKTNFHNIYDLIGNTIEISYIPK